MSNYNKFIKHHVHTTQMISFILNASTSQMMSDVLKHHVNLK